MKATEDKHNNLATPGKPMSQKKFTTLIKEAEDGEFLSENEFRLKFEQWRLQRKK